MTTQVRFGGGRPGAPKRVHEPSYALCACSGPCSIAWEARTSIDEKHEHNPKRTNKFEKLGWNADETKFYYRGEKGVFWLNPTNYLDKDDPASAISDARGNKHTKAKKMDDAALGTLHFIADVRVVLPSFLPPFLLQPLVERNAVEARERGEVDTAERSRDRSCNVRGLDADSCPRRIGDIGELRPDATWQSTW